MSARAYRVKGAMVEPDGTHLGPGDTVLLNEDTARLHLQSGLVEEISEAEPLPGIEALAAAVHALDEGK